MSFKATLFLLMVFCYTVRESTTTEYIPSTEFDTQHINTSITEELDNAIVHYNSNLQGVANSQKLPPNSTQSITTTDKITLENQSSNNKTNTNGSNDSILHKLESAEDKIYKVAYLKCEKCPDEAAEEKQFWDKIRKSKSQPATMLEVKDHGDEIEILKKNKIDKNKMNSNTTDARKYGIENISVMNSENHPMVYMTNRADYNKKVDLQTLVQLQKFRKANKNKLNLPGMSAMFRSSANIRSPPKHRMRAEEHGAGTFGDVYNDEYDDK